MMQASEHAVVIAGGGPTGMMLGIELTLAGTDVVVVEQRPNAELVGSRAGGLHARALELLDQRGMVGRFLAEGRTVQAAMFGTTVLDMSDFPTRHPYSLGIWQNRIERQLTDWAGELGVPVRYGCGVSGFTAHPLGVRVELTTGSPVSAQYLVGCDGGRSVVRRAAGIDFPGWEATRSNLIAEVEVTEEPPTGIQRDAVGVHGLQRLEDGRTVRVVTTEQHLGPTSEPTLGELSAALVAVFGTDFGVHNPTWISRFTDATRQAAAYRTGRVLVAGDAAHIHYPAGGQGLSLGLADAVNLGWKLAQVVDGTSPAALLDTYHAERHPAGARAIRHTMAQTALQRGDDRTMALVDVLSEVIEMDGPRRLLAGIVSGLDIHYDLGVGHPLLGRRMPDLDLVTAEGARRVYELLHSARPVLLNLTRPGRFDLSGWSGRVDRVDGSTRDRWELPVLGTVPAPEAVLIRPDGYVAWVADANDDGLDDALTRWFGRPSTGS
jgi:3-(3-hydroxy-phenyl)propionate hydroxylase